MINIALFGAGRIGSIHAHNINSLPNVSLRYIIDGHNPNAKVLAEATGAHLASEKEAFDDHEIDAVMIASPTDTHADLIIKAAALGKHIFCEKPVDLSLKKVDACVKAVESAEIHCEIGFNRRFDPSFAALKKALVEGEIGPIELVQITSRDPAPPPQEYLEVSGGLFKDMSIHDLDMARWLLGEEPSEVYAQGSVLVASRILEANDIDTAIITLKTPSGKLAQITNSRRAVYGYDQRLEVHGSLGMLRVENIETTKLQRFGGKGVESAKPLDFFLERYREAYQIETTQFIEKLSHPGAPMVSIRDGRQALVLAEAAGESMRTGTPVRL